MATLSRVGNILANRYHLPANSSKIVLLRYYAGDMIPNITNSKYLGELGNKGKGDTVYVRREPVFVTVDRDINANINWQDVDLERVTVTLDYNKETGGAIDYADVELSDLALTNLCQEAMRKAHAEAVNSTLIQSVYASATSTGTSTAWQTSTNSATALAEAGAILSTLKIPEEERWALIHPKMAQFLTQIQAGWALNSGFKTGAQITGHIGQYAGLNIFVSPLVAGSGTAGVPYKALAGQRDAIAMAANIMNARICDMMPLRPGTGVYHETIFGFKVTQPDALVYMPGQVA
jgi:hypothetical protein